MITIYTEGQMLDLDPSGTFEITYEQPMLDDSHCPVPFSTSIGLLPTLNNKKIIGFLDAMLLEPEVKRIKADIFVGGFQILSGILVYDGVEDGIINYSFSGKNLEEDWGAKIWESVNPSTSTLPFTSDQTQKIGMLNGIQSGSHFLAAPMIVEKNAIAKTVHNVLSSFTEVVEVCAKFHNYPGVHNSANASLFTPAFRVWLILETILKNTTIDSACALLLNKLAIIAQYKPNGQFNKFGISLNYAVDCQTMLPDITVYEMTHNIAKMLCASIYRDGQKYKFLTAGTVLNSTDILDWSEKISIESCTLGKEPAASYTFKYNNSDQDNSYDLANLSSDLSNGDISQTYYWDHLLNLFGDETDDGPWPVKSNFTKDIYSGRVKFLNIDDVYKYVAYCDIIYHHNPTMKVGSEDSESSFDNSTDFNLVRCIPVTYASGNTYYSRLAPIIESPVIGAARGTDVFIGILSGNQLTDKGHTINTDYSDSNSGFNIAPDALFNSYHKVFSDWLAKDRQVVTADLNLSIKDIIDFRMYNKVRFASRVWLVKKLTLNMAIDSDHIEATGEFISL